MRALIIFLIALPCFAVKTPPMEFLKEQGIKNQKKFRYNQYESIISGGLAFLVGNIGYHQTDSASLKLAYSGIQTIGILNVGQGIYDYYRPVFDKELYLALRDPKNTPKEIIHIFAQEERAKRLSLLYKSSLLATQYFANAYLGKTEQNLKEIYKFLAGVNLIVVGYAYFYKDRYEEYYYSNSISPIFMQDEKYSYVGLGFHTTF